MSGYSTRLRWCKRSHCLSSQLSPQVKAWLFDSGSLTSRLISYCSGKFSVKVLSVKNITPTPDEISALALRPRSRALIRQVLLCCDDLPLVYARTIIPVSSLRGRLRGLVLLGNRPLGAVLFSDKSMQRGAMEITSISPSHPCYSWTLHKGEKKIWGRRSVFVLKKQSLLVSEFFLPEVVNQAEEGNRSGSL